MPSHSDLLRPTRRWAIALAATALALTAGFLVSCAGGSAPPATSAVAPSPTATVTGESPSASPSETIAPAPALVPDGTATENLPFFASIVAAVWASPDNVSGRAYIDALEANGFDKAAMQVTADRSTVGNAAESIQFSVVWAGECLVGQVGPATGQPVTVVLPPLDDGTCLLGQTRPIDW